MASPDVWTDARTRIAAADLDGSTIAWPNENYELPATPAPWVAVEIDGDMSDPVELGASGVWQESGTVWCHVMVPVGTGVATGLALRKTLANEFRGVSAGGITYDGATFDPGAPADDSGMYHRLTVGIRYRYHDQ